MTTNADASAKTRKQTAPIWLAIRGAALILLALIFLNPRTSGGYFPSFILGSVGVAIAATAVIRGAQHGWTAK